MKGILFILIAWLLTLLTCLEGSGVRTWTSADGREIRGSIAGKVGGQSVRLLMTDGRIFTIPLSRLSFKDQKYVEQWEPGLLRTPTIEEAVYTIRNVGSAGTGFLMQMDGLSYLVTNQHVIQGARREDLEVVNSKLDQLPLGPLEVVPELDLARILVPRDSGLLAHPNPRIRERISAYGNSAGADVVTSNPGSILGLGATQVEVDAEIVPGNSGGPIATEDGKVVGVASYLMRTQSQRVDWTNQDTRYSETRRFGLRVYAEFPWQEVDWALYAESGKELDSLLRDFSGWFAVAVPAVSRPLDPIELPDAASSYVRDFVDVQIDNAARLEIRLNDRVSPNDLSRINRFERRKIKDIYVKEGESMERVLSRFNQTERRYWNGFYQAQVDRVEAELEEWMQFVTWSSENRDLFRFFD